MRKRANPGELSVAQNTNVCWEIRYADWRRNHFVHDADMAALFASAVNFIRTHGPAVLQALARGPQQAGGEDAKDAARYRFLRDRCNHKGPPTAILFSSDLEPDAAIDAAIGGTGDA